MPELELSLEPHAVASLSVFHGVDSIPDELLAPGYLSQCHHLDTHSPTPTPPPTREREKTFKERSLGKGGQSTKRRGGEERRETRKGGMKYTAGEGRERRGRGREEQA